MADEPTTEAERTETPAAAKAFEDYYGIGDDRSLSKLETVYQTSTEPVPTKHIGTLKIWSTSYGWQERVKQRDAEAAAERRAAMAKRVDKFRSHLLDGLETDIRLKLQELQQGKPVLAQDATALDKLTKLYFQLAEQPLVDAQDIGLHGVDGKPPVGVAISEVLRNPAAAEKACELEEVLATSGATDTGGVSAEPE